MSVTAVLITREATYPTDIHVAFPFDEVIVKTHCPNVRMRFELAERANSDIIYVQDDDIEIDIHQLWKHYDGTLTHAITDYHLKAYAGSGVTLIGFGAFFPKSAINFGEWIDRYGGVDAMEADRIFTYFTQPHNSVLMPIRQVDRPVKMCERPGHYTIRDQIIRQLQEFQCVSQ